MKDALVKIKISPQTSIKEALKKIDQAGMAILFVCDSEGRLIGSLTDGDIRRRILKTGDLREEISECFNSDPVFVEKGGNAVDLAKKLMIEKTIEVIPVVDERKAIVDVLFWKDLFGTESLRRGEVDVPVVIMAGGKGERLGPFTKIFPKSLIPLGEEPIIKMIIDRFRKYGVKLFYITLNYKGEMIKIYLEGVEKNYKVEYVWEEKFLGTAGSLKLLPPGMDNDFIVSNSDIIVDLDYQDLLDFHRGNKNVLTIVGSIQHHRVPYGIIHFEKDGKIREIQEKPEFDFTINTGMYVLSKESLDFIPGGEYFDMTNLIQKLLSSGKNVGTYPVSEKSYMDVGQWEEYKQALDRFKAL